MSFFAGLFVASSMVKAYSTVYEGFAMKAYYDAQAAMSQVKYKSLKLQAKEEGIRAMEAMNENLSTLIARGAAGGTLTMDGSNLITQFITHRTGVEDVFTARINEELQQNLGVIEFNSLRRAGKLSKKYGYINAVGQLGMDVASAYGTGLFDKDLTTQVKKGVGTKWQQINRPYQNPFTGMQTGSIY